MISVILACMLMLESPAVSMAAVQPEKSETVVMTSAAAAGTASKTSGKVRMVILAASGGIVKRRRLPMEQWFCPGQKRKRIYISGLVNTKESDRKSSVSGI